jgi:hypothetical protein
MYIRRILHLIKTYIRKSLYCPVTTPCCRYLTVSHSLTVTTSLSLPHCHYLTVTTSLTLPRCHYLIVTASLTTSLSLPHCHYLTVTTPLSLPYYQYPAVANSLSPSSTTSPNSHRPNTRTKASSLLLYINPSTLTYK